ncbi:sigma-E factor negative regulatory protein [Massilia sp. PAMC28688]|uniref:sigma-E factor negative regulatory protein n=1 Tax=Massilia sp. PAMC28688 TaxID=2861283 RepID=UPI001C63757E|nr:sigma-E factor negative regulatory protein [Massilia sp. PAMC28688]QYF92572.1 sigma-E factor negative regulatory protein [Massilia sp. PAMC28688]
MDTHKKIREHISALSDGALCSTDLELAMAAMQTEDGRQAWHLYHRIGDVLRAQATPELSDSFASKLAARLAEEPLPLRRNPRVQGEARPGGPSVHLMPAGQGEPAMACEAGPEGVAVSHTKPAIISVS